MSEKSLEERVDSCASFKISKQEDKESHILQKRYPDEFEYEVSKRRFKSGENTRRSIDLCTPTTVFSSDLFGGSSFGRRVASLVGESLLIPDDEKLTEIHHQFPQQGNEVRRVEKWIERHRCHRASGNSASGSLSTELHTSSRRPPYMMSFMFSDLQGRCSFSKGFLEEQTGNSELLMLENKGSKISAKYMSVYSTRRQGFKEDDDKQPRNFDEFQLQMLAREVDERPLQTVQLQEYRKYRLLKKFGKIWNWHCLQHGLEETSATGRNTRNRSSDDSEEKNLFKPHISPSEFSFHEKSPEENSHIRNSIISKVVEDVEGEWHVGTNSMESNGFCPLNSSKGFTSSKSNKHSPDSQTEQRFFGRNPGMKLLYPKMMKQVSCLDKMMQTENVEVNTTALENGKETDPSNRWIKRLKLQQTDAPALGTKDFTMDDASSSRRTHKLLTRVLNYSRSNSDFTIANHLEEEKQQIVTSVEVSSVESLKNSHSWIRRWCCKNKNAGSSKIMYVEKSTCPKLKMQVPSKPETPDLNVLPRSIQFPSLAALALMGKAISNFKPCEFRRRGTSLVWDTDVQL